VVRLRTRVAQATALHQQAVAATDAAAQVLRGYAPASAAADHHAEERTLAARLRSSAARLAPGWLDAPLDAISATTPLGGSTLPTFVRIGQAHPLDDAGFPVMVPLLRAGHIAIDADARDPRVSGLLRSLVLRLLAAAPPGSIQIRIVDSAEIGATFEAFHAARDAAEAAIAPAVTNPLQLRDLLTEAERWVERRAEHEPTQALLLVVASLPELTDGHDLARISALAKAGPAGRLHIIAAGWPPPPLTAETTQRPLPYCTQIVLRNPHAWVGDPPGASFAANGTGPSRLNAPVYLDPDPPPALIQRVCGDLAAAEHPENGWQPELAVTAWREYIAAAQHLDAVRRGAASLVAEHGTFRSAAVEELTTVRARLAGQATHLTELATAAGLPPPTLRSTPRLLDAGPRLLEAGPRLLEAGPPSQDSAITALRNASALLDAADAALAGAEGPAAVSGVQGPAAVSGAPWASDRRFGRSLAIYGLFAALAALAQIPLILLVDDLRAVAVLVVGAAFALPALGYGLAFLLLGALDDGPHSERTPLAGLVLSVACAAPLLGVAGYLLVSSLMR
jgi:hypothetical protein